MYFNTYILNILYYNLIIWDVLNIKYMFLPIKEEWKTIAEYFETLWNLPNCIGGFKPVQSCAVLY